MAGSTPLHGVSARSDPLSIGYSLGVASLAGAANVMLTNPIWCARNPRPRCQCNCNNIPLMCTASTLNPELISDAPSALQSDRRADQVTGNIERGADQHDG